MRVAWIFIGALTGLILGALVGLLVALAVMQAHPRNDGTYGMREMLVCLPCGALAGLVAGIIWGCRPAWP